jgi:hypothetical protein
VLETRTDEQSGVSARPGAASAASPGMTEFLLEILGSARSYDAHIREAEWDGDVELARFLRGLQRQDLARIGEAARLLRRPFGPASGDAEGGDQPC